LLRVDGPLMVFGGPYSNLEATRAVLGEAARLEISADRIICTGDVVAYGADPAATVALMRGSARHVVMGNCEQSIAAGSADCGCGFPTGSTCERLSAAWFALATRELNADARAWMADLPRRIDIEIGGCRLAVIHGGVDIVNRFVFASSARAIKLEEIRRQGLTGSLPVTAACHSLRRSTGSHGITLAPLGCPRTTGRRGFGSVFYEPKPTVSRSSIVRSTTISRQPPPKFAAPAYPRSMRPRSRPASGPAATCCLRKRFTNAAQPSSQAVRFGRARCDRRRHLAVGARPFAPNFGRATIVCNWHFADIARSRIDFRFRCKSGHAATSPQ